MRVFHPGYPSPLLFSREITRDRRRYNVARMQIEGTVFFWSRQGCMVFDAQVLEINPSRACNRLEVEFEATRLSPQCCINERNDTVELYQAGSTLHHFVPGCLQETGFMCSDCGFEGSVMAFEMDLVRDKHFGLKHCPNCASTKFDVNGRVTRSL